MAISWKPTLGLAFCLISMRAPGQQTRPAITRAATSSSLGIFQGHADIGTVPIPGSAHYDAAQQTYTITGNGDNMWFGEDDFHYAWKKVSGDVSLTADIAFVGQTGNNHRKAVLMIRQSLDGNSACVDVARHGDGLTSLQFRDTTGGNTHEVESNVSAPQRVRIEKRGDYFYAFISGKDGKLEPAGASTYLPLVGPFYVGIGVSSHDKIVSETAIFSHVQLNSLPPATGKPVLASTLETITVASTDRRVAYFAPANFEAPNWSRDGSFLLFNQEGKIYRLPLNGMAPILVDTAPESHINNDHGISPDGQFLAVSDQSNDRGSSIYILPIGGGTPRQVTQNSPSYWHGWSPDGTTLAFTGQRNGNFDIYTIPSAGGQENRLTTARGLNDGPEYSPDGQYIYFNSERTGSMQIWRMKADGSDQEQVLSDETNDWFPHISPDGKWMVFLAYEKGVTGHPAEKQVQLFLMSMTDKKVHLLAKLFGGQGTINVPSWSPDSSKLAFVSYELLPSESASAK
jgi:TolB protein